MDNIETISNLMQQRMTEVQKMQAHADAVTTIDALIKKKLLQEANYPTLREAGKPLKQRDSEIRPKSDDKPPQSVIGIHNPQYVSTKQFTRIVKAELTERNGLPIVARELFDVLKPKFKGDISLASFKTRLGKLYFAQPNAKIGYTLKGTKLILPITAPVAPAMSTKLKTLASVNANYRPEPSKQVVTDDMRNTIQCYLRDVGEAAIYEIRRELMNTYDVKDMPSYKDVGSYLANSPDFDWVAGSTFENVVLPVSRAQ